MNVGRNESDDDDDDDECKGSCSGSSSRVALLRAALCWPGVSSCISVLV